MNYCTNIDIEKTHTLWDENASPFHHIILDDFLEKPFAHSLAQALKEYVLTQKKNFVHYTAKWEKLKYTQNKIDIIPSPISDTIRYFNSEDFISVLEKVTGLHNLIPDEALWGGGIHATFHGGKLNIHNDFTILPTTFHKEFEWQRVLNLILYLNENYRPEWKGQLELWDKEMKVCEKSIDPLFNRAVLFHTYLSNHGQPDPYAGPSDEPRLSLALYYYQKVVPGTIERRSTLYKLRPWEKESDEENKERLKRADAEERYKEML